MGLPQKGFVSKYLELLVDVGRACEKFHNDKVVGIKSRRIQADEIWSFVYDKEKNTPENVEGVGDVWTWTAIDADSKLIISWLVGDGDADAANTINYLPRRPVRCKILS